MVSAVRAAWPNPDRESDTILRTLEESLAISAAARTGSAWAYSQRRAQWNRNNLAARLREERGRGSPPKVMMKFGYNHMIRGANYFNIFDLGAMTDEVAALSGAVALSISSSSLVQVLVRLSSGQGGASSPSRAMSLTNSEPATNASRACFQTPMPRVMK